MKKKSAKQMSQTTEKVTIHGFHRFYEPYLHELKTRFMNAQNPTLIEIGVYEGKSIPYWLEKVPWSYIGLDKTIQPFEKGKVKCVSVDQGNEKELDDFVKEHAKRDVLFINDDGSHIPDHQVLTFNKLFPLLQEGGIYFLEDIETSYWTRGNLYDMYTLQYGFRHPSSVVERFKDALDVLNYEYLHEENRKSLQKICEANGFDIQVLLSVRSIKFGPNFIAIEKQRKDDENFLNRNYRLKCYL